MQAQKQAQTDREAVTYSRRLSFYDSDEGIALLQQLAEQRGVKAAALLRMLVREEARRTGVLPSEDRTEDLFAAWAEEDATDDPEELAHRAADWETLKANLNAN